MTFTVYVAEDEPIAREALVARVGAVPGWRVVGAAADGRAALLDCLRDAPDLLLTDIRMPLLDGLELCAALRESGSPTAFVLVTAYEQHAVQAFRLAALDYLLKPIDDGDLARCLERAEATLRGRRALHDLADGGGPAANALRLGSPSVKRLVVRSVGRIDIVPLSQVIAFRAERNYVDVITEDRTWMHRETMKSLTERLDAASFVQVHRSIIVAVSRVRGIERDGMRARVLMDNGERYPVGASFVGAVDKILDA